MQCSGCAAATAELPGELDAKLELCQAGLAGLAVREGTAAAVGILQGQQHSSGSSGAAGELLQLQAEQLQQLMHATRLYHLQQQWWYDYSKGNSDAQGSSDGGSSSSRGEASLVGCVPLAPVDQVQLANVQQLLQPLRDVAALREMQLQQLQGGCVWPMARFEGMVHDALEQVCSERGQQRAVVKRLQQLATAPPGGVRLAAAAGVQQSRQAGSVMLSDDSEAALASGSASEEGSEDMMDLDIEPEALDLLAAAAEDFVVQQLAAASDLAVDVAGRQEVGPADVRVALSVRGHGHILAQLKRALQQDC
jgi:hypothetical protein